MLTKKAKVKTLFSSLLRSSAATSCQKSRAECCADCFTMEQIVHFINSYIIPSRSLLCCSAPATCSCGLQLCTWRTCIFVRHANGACSNTLITWSTGRSSIGTAGGGVLELTFNFPLSYSTTIATASCPSYHLVKYDYLKHVNVAQTIYLARNIQLTVEFDYSV